MNMAVDILFATDAALVSNAKSFRLIDKDTHQVYFGIFAIVRKYSHLFFLEELADNRFKGKSRIPVRIRPYNKHGGS